MAETSLARAAGLALLLALVPLHGGAQSATPVRVLELGGDGGTEAAYALAGGYFKKYGIDATVSGTSSGGAVVAAVVGGSADIGFSNLLSVAAAMGRGVPITIVAPGGMFVREAPDIVLARAKHSGLRTGADLTGKIVAVTTLDGELQLGAQVWIDKTGGNAKNVRFVEMPEAAMGAALVAGRIDAAMMTGSYFSQARNDVELLGNADAAIAPHFISGVFFATTAWVQAQPDTVRRVDRALRETAHWANTHRAETAPILAKNSDLDPATIAAMVRSTFAETISVPEMQPPIDVGLAYGRLKAPLDVRQIVVTAQSFWGR
jgi:NitT/TauT family transport system substrate-binding protein